VIRSATIRGAVAADRVAAMGLVAGLGAIVAGRFLATRLGLDPLLVGAAFGLALAGLWYAGMSPRTRRQPFTDSGSVGLALVAGLATGLVLVGVALAGALFGGLQLAPGVARPAAPFAAWAVVTILVAAAEEGILRGALFDALRSAGGTAMALLVTTVAFALIHIPLYGWGVVPLDLGVGLALGGLRLSTRTVLGPAFAHAVADLATWWL